MKSKKNIAQGNSASVTVCMATYNGVKYLSEQVMSVLSQLNASDELIIVDDCSVDNTVELIRNINDPRIIVIKNNENKREIKTFERAISLAKNDLIFLSDQDDIWVPGRLNLMSRALINGDADVVASNFTWIDSRGSSINVTVDGVSADASRSYIKNITDIFLGKTNYYGCAMAFHRRFLPIVLPIPRLVESHDLWIALAANLARSNSHLNDVTLLKRQHGSNATSPVSTRKLHQKIWSRVIFLVCIVIVFRRLIIFYFRRTLAENRNHTL